MRFFNPPMVLAAVFAAILVTGCDGSGSAHGGHDHHHDGPDDDVHARVTASSVDGGDCNSGFALGVFPCLNINMLGGLQFSSQASDIWGWSDVLNGDEYAIVGLSTGTAFVRITEPATPQFVGYLPTATEKSDWRDIKTLNDHAFIVSEAPGHGLQVVDLSVLATLDQPTILTADVHYTEFGDAHNVAVNSDSNYVYVVGSNTCGAGLHMIDATEPKQLVFAGCYSADGYTHDVQCVNYIGPDEDYLGREICFAANEDTLTLVDVSDKQAPTLIARKSYVGAAYTHQGWLSEDQRYFFLGDEYDELAWAHNTRTYLWDLSDLDAPVQSHRYTATTAAMDHNLYVLGDHLFQANYAAGVRILRLGNLAEGEMAEVAYFDTYPFSDGPDSVGTWSVYPYFPSGALVTANISGEFFVLQPQLAKVPRCDDGLDNDGDGAADFPGDLDCTSSAGEFEH